MRIQECQSVSVCVCECLSAFAACCFSEADPLLKLLLFALLFLALL